MQTLPVIDVRHAIAVQAMRGQRDLYPALVTPLSPDSDPVNVAKGFRTLARFPAIYIADLDGIEGSLRQSGFAGAVGQRASRPRHLAGRRHIGHGRSARSFSHTPASRSCWVLNPSPMRPC
jgi:hypothetical protein